MPGEANRHILKTGLNKLKQLIFHQPLSSTCYKLPSRASLKWHTICRSYLLSEITFTAEAVAIDFALFNVGLPLPPRLNQVAEWSAVPAAGHLPWWAGHAFGTASVGKALHHPISPYCWAWRAARSTSCLGAGYTVIWVLCLFVHVCNAIHVNGTAQTTGDSCNFCGDLRRCFSAPGSPQNYC